MNKLLSAEFTRLFKSAIFRIILILAVCDALFEVAVQCIEEGRDFPIDSYITEWLPFAGFIAAVFIGLFIGREYSDRTLNNKIIAGHKRIEIYLSELIVCIAAGFIVQVVYIAAFSVPAMLLCDGFYGSFKEIVIAQLLGLCVIAAYIAIFLPVSMLMQSKSGGLVISIIMSLVILFGGSYVYLKLSWQISDAEISELEEANEEYDASYYADMNRLTENELKAFQFLNDFLPSTQQMNISDFGIPDNAGRYPLYDGAIIVVTTLCGVLLFRRKDIR